MKTCTYETRIGASIGARGGAAACKAPAQKRGGLAQLLAFCLASMLLVALFGAAQPAKALAVETVYVDSWSALYDALQGDGNHVVLEGDVKYGEGGGDHASSALTVPEGVTVTLDLNGHIVDRALTTATSGGSVIDVAGNLTITDSDPTATHDGSITYTLPTSDEVVAVNGGIITGGNAASVTVGSGSSRIERVGGGGMLLRGNAALTMSGGTICANQTTGNGGGLYALTGAIINMDESAVIAGNSATMNGGGVFLRKGCDLSMSGNAMIRGNLLPSSYLYGGGVYLYEGNTVDMSGNASICDNKAYAGGGAWVAAWHNIFTITGNATIAGNIATSTSDSSGGGGIIVEGSSNEGTDSKLVMTGGSISGNKSAGYGGGVEVNCEGIFEMSGGSITENEAKYGGGVYVRFGYNYNDPGVLRLSGSPVISGNTGTFADYNGPQYLHNVYAQTRIHVTGSLAGANIGIAPPYGVSTMPTESKPYDFTRGFATYNEGVDPATIFKSDGPYKITVSEAEATAGEAQLSVPVKYDLWIAGTQVTELNCDDVFSGGTVSYDPETNVLTLDGYDSGADPGTWPVPQGSTYYNDTFTLYSDIAEGITIKVVGDSVIRGAGTFPSGCWNAWVARFRGATTIDIADGATLDFIGGTGVNGSSQQSGIFISDGHTTITGQGAMNVRPANDETRSGYMVDGYSFTVDGPDVTITAGKNSYSYCTYDASPTVLSGSLTMDATASDTYLMYRYTTVTAGEGLVIYLGGTEDTLQKQYGQSGTFMQAGYLKVCEPYMYDLWVAGVPVTKTNAADLTVIDGVDVASGGEARFDAETGTLYLKDATITNRKTGATDALSSGIYAEMDLRIEARGTNAVTATTEGSYWRTSGIGMQGYHQDTGAEYGLDIVLVDGATLTCTGANAPDSAAYHISSYGIYVNPANNAPVSVAGTGTLNAYGGTEGTWLDNSFGFAPGAYTQDGDVVVNAIGGGSARSIYGMYSNSAEIKSGTLVAEAIGAEGDHWSRGIYNNGTFTLSGGSVKATGGPTADSGDSYGFFKGQYGSLVITGGTFEAKTLATTGNHRALYYKVGYGMGDNVAVSPVKASVKADGSGAVAYVTDDNDTYNWFMAPAVHTVSFDANGGTGSMASFEIGHGESYKLPACEFAAPANKEFDAWSAGVPGATVTVNADLVLKAQWKAVVKTTLNADIAKAQKSPYTDAVKTSADGTDVPVSEKWVTSAAKKALADALAAAKEVAANTHATQAQVDAAAKTLEKAMAGYAPAPGKLCTVSFDANGGSGTMKAAQVVAGSMYELPACGFTAPSGKQFDKWDKGAVGAKVKVTGNVTVKAVWKDKSTPKPEPEVDKAPLEDAVGAAQEALALQYVVESADGTDVPRARAWATPEAKKALAGALAAAEEVLADGGATQAQVDAAQEALDKALADFGPRPGTAVATWKRLAGDSAFKTMSAIIDEGGFEVGGTVVLASLEGYWDALTAAGVAGLEKAPVVMSTSEGLSPEAKAQLQRLAPKKIVVCGGTYWLPDALLSEAAAAAGTSPEVVRLAGDNAALTAGQIAAYGKGRWSDTAIVATAGTFQDALAAAPVSWARAMPIFLAQFDFAAEKGYITPETIAAMKGAGIAKAYIAGGTYWLPKGVSDDLAKAGIEVVDQLMGDTAVETSAAIAAMATSKLGMEPDRMGVANVAQHYDALASASFCGKANSVLLLARDENSSMIGGFVKSNGPKVAFGYVFGGTGSVSDATMAALEGVTK